MTCTRHTHLSTFFFLWSWAGPLIASGLQKLYEGVDRSNRCFLSERLQNRRRCKVFLTICAFRVFLFFSYPSSLLSRVTPPTPFLCVLSSIALSCLIRHITFPHRSFFLKLFYSPHPNNITFRGKKHCFQLTFLHPPVRVTVGEVRYSIEIDVGGGS